MLESSYEPIESQAGNGDNNASSAQDEKAEENGFLRGLRSQVNQTVIVSKLFYFFFYTALGSLFPFFSLFYKQLWLTAWQIGILLALRPAVKIVCLPLWKMVTDKYSKPKVVYFISIFGWLIGYFGQSLIFPSNLPCYVYITPTPFTSLPANNISKREVSFIPEAEGLKPWDPRELHVRKSERSLDGTKPETFGGQMDDRDNYAKITKPLSDLDHDDEVSEAREHKGFAFARESKGDNFVNQKGGVNFEDNSVENDVPYTPNPYKIVTGVQGNINPFPDPSDIRKRPKPPDDFRVLYNRWIFQTLVVIVILTEIITTPTPMLADSAVVRALVDSDSEYGRQRLFGSLGLSLAAILVAIWVTQDSTCPYTDTINYLPCFYVFEIAMGGTLIVSLFFTFEKPDDSETGYSLMDGLKLFKTFKNAVFLATLFLFGYSHSLQIAFLFWYLQDLGGSPVLFAIILLVYCFAEVVMYFVSPYVVDMIGQHGMISVALACYTARFLMYSYLADPWLVIPMEVVQGVTYGGVWSIAAVYVDAPQGEGIDYY